MFNQVRALGLYALLIVASLPAYAGDNDGFYIDLGVMDMKERYSELEGIPPMGLFEMGYQWENGFAVLFHHESSLHPLPYDTGVSTWGVKYRITFTRIKRLFQ